MRPQLGGLAVAAVMAACGHAPPAPTTPAAPAARVKLAVLPAESDQFPKAARAATDAMTHARVGGVSDTEVSKVSLEVVQLSIECDDATPACYEAAGKSLAANRLLFTQIAAGDKPGQVKVSVTLFDVDADAPKHTAEKVFAREDDASAGAAALVAEAAQP